MEIKFKKRREGEEKVKAHDRGSLYNFIIIYVLVGTNKLRSNDQNRYIDSECISQN